MDETGAAMACPSTAGELVDSMQVGWSSLLYVDVKGGSRDSWASSCSCLSSGAVVQEQRSKGLARMRGEMDEQYGDGDRCIFEAMLMPWAYKLQQKSLGHAIAGRREKFQSLAGEGNG